MTQSVKPWHFIVFLVTVHGSRQPAVSREADGFHRLFHYGHTNLEVFVSGSRRGGFTLVGIEIEHRPDAVGVFVIDVLHNGAPENQTFLVGADQTDKIEVARTVPAVITVVTEPSCAVR